jgi:CheY-like chemotaxis protein
MPANATSAWAPLVLLIDDVEDNRDAYVPYLEHVGFRTATAADGADGLAKALDLKPDVIVLDLHLPVLDGWQLAQRLKQTPETQATPIVALTADVTPGARERALAAGVAEFCEKPCAPPDLAATVRRHLAREA